MKLHHSIQTKFFLLLTTVLCWTCVVVQAKQLDWQQQKVDWLAVPGGRIKAIRYPQGETLPFLTKPGKKTSTATQKSAITDKSASDFRLFSLESTELKALANTIDSPPIAGFVPRIVIDVTDRHSDDTDWVAETHMSTAGKHLTDNPETNFAIGLFDTGASTHIINYAAANRTGIYDADLVTSSYIELAGATNSTFGRVSQPLGVF
ncbi:MAG: hypothetical protein PVH77_09195, partial [Phycisphaerales bacterium]